jgi:lysophospholipase L1-like esterase
MADQVAVSSFLPSVDHLLASGPGKLWGGGMIRNLWISLLAITLPLGAKEKPAWPAELAAYVLDPAPETGGLLLKQGDRLAICGDSITEQKQYSLIIEAYLTACLPELEVTCRQFGWGGEQAGGFLKRLNNDVLRFKPNIATTCYGMNDFRYVPYDEAIAAEYRRNQAEIVRIFKENNCRVILGSSGIIDSVPHWVKSAAGTQQDLNLALAKFRNITLEVAKAGQAGFADVYQPMLLADLAAKQKFGPEFKVAGKDGVHPGWAGQIIMARAFLKAMGIDGDIATITWDEASDKASARSRFQAVTSALRPAISIDGIDARAPQQAAVVVLDLHVGGGAGVRAAAHGVGAVVGDLEVLQSDALRRGRRH